MPEAWSDLLAAWPLITGGFAAGGAWVAVKKAMNGTAANIKRTDDTVSRLEGKVDRLLRSDSAQNERLRGLEEKIDSYGGWIRRVEKTANKARDQ